MLHQSLAMITAVTVGIISGGNTSFAFEKPRDSILEKIQGNQLVFTTETTENAFGAAARDFATRHLIFSDSDCPFKSLNDRHNRIASTLGGGEIKYYRLNARKSFVDAQFRYTTNRRGGYVSGGFSCRLKKEYLGKFSSSDDLPADWWDQ